MYIFINSTMSDVVKSITQKLDYGCGVACFAFACEMSFDEAVTFLGKHYSVKRGWKPSDLVTALGQFGLRYKNHYVRKKKNHQLRSWLNSLNRKIKELSCRALFNINDSRLDGSLD